MRDTTFWFATQAGADADADPPLAWGLAPWQAWRSARRREALARGIVNLAAALLVLQWCAVLVAWAVLPFALWR